jgi:phospho-N-acetylmuramoyl-pentapeptide-transferase
MTLQLIQGLLLAFAIVVILMPPYIRLLRFIGMGKKIREEGPETHLVKQGTPTMGGLLVIGVVIALYFVLRGPPTGGVIPPLAALGFVGLLGAADDYFNARSGEGIRARQKMLWLIVVGGAAAFFIQSTYGIDQVSVPFVGPVFVDRWVYVAFAALAIVAAANGVNITDGLDGLAAGSAALVFAAFVVVGFTQFRHPGAYDLLAAGSIDVAVVAAAFMGACVGFLWWNAPPAQVFMGDTGALAIGGAMAGMALLTNTHLLLPIVGGLYVIETLSVIAQVISFRGFGRRVLRMSPIHHHFEVLGWPESTIIVRFWILAGLAMALGLGFFYADFINIPGIIE